MRVGVASMNISAKTEYACIAVLELAACASTGEPVRIKQIADKHGIPSRFLVQILLQLKGAGLVTSTRGAAGGYQLAKDPRKITLLDVMTVIEGPPSEESATGAKGSSVSRVLWRTWKQIAKAEREMLDNITFADLVERVKGPSEAMYYI
jgi:Rrf2 family protein